MIELPILQSILTQLETNALNNANDQVIFRNALLTLQSTGQDTTSVSSSGDAGSESYSFVSATFKLQALVDEAMKLEEQIRAYKELLAASGPGIIKGW